MRFMYDDLGRLAACKGVLVCFSVGVAFLDANENVLSEFCSI